jgi:small GTP-binding protein
MRLLTPSGIGGVAVLAVPADAVAAIRAQLRVGGGRRIENWPPRRPMLAQLALQGVQIDQVIVVDRGPGGLELHLHGAPAVVEAVRQSLPGVTADSELDAPSRLLRSALCHEQLDLALEQLQQPFAAYLANLMALPGPQRRLEVEQALARSVPAMAMAIPRRVVLVGAQNAGKSSLFNRLLFRERVLAGPCAGLTRDPVVETTTLSGYPYEIVDTAGEGATSSLLDRGAIEAGRLLRPGSLVVLVVDLSGGSPPVDRALVAEADLVLGNKADVRGESGRVPVECDARISCATQDGGAIRRVVGELLRELRVLPAAGAVGGVAALEPGQFEALQALK